MQRYKLTVRDAAMAFAADKYLLRDFVRSRVGSRYLARILARWETAAEASCSHVPAPFVVKASHGSGMNRIVRTGRFSDEELRSLLLSWSKKRYFWNRREWVYKYLVPRFYAEEYLGGDGEAPKDYKAFVFNGRVEFVQVDVDRFGDHRRALFDRDWNLLPIEYVYGQPRDVPEAPTVLDEMIDVAEKLGEEFIFSRVDMYAIGSRVVVGEITFYPEAGFGRFGSTEQDLYMGEKWRWPGRATTAGGHNLS